MEEEDSTSGLYKPHMEAESESVNVSVQPVELPNGDECQSIPEIDDSQLLGAPEVVAADGVVGDKEANSTADVETKTKTEVKVEERGGGKRKRGRPPRFPIKSPPSKRNKEEGEDVCFICFDGGSLVLCDRRGCPKAYHPACIKRDEAFFRSKARWNCGWHICSICQKAAHYMCYTCTYSLCKGCTKDAEYVCVRGNKGFCTICMRTIMLIENNEQGNKETALVDFDDKSSWEYLFKVYWIYLKEKLSLTFSELTQAKNPWKGVDTMACRGKSSEVRYSANDGKGSISDSSCRSLEAYTSKRRKTTEDPELLNKDSVSTERLGGDKGTTSIGCTEWASKELLEFVAHMRNGDISVLSQFDVQALLLDYIKRNNLRDPRQKSQIICDLRLENLFGKPRVGHFEMLKLLEFHFLIKEDSQKDVIIQGNIVDAILSQVEADGNHNDHPMMGKDKRRKPRRKCEERGPQTNLNEYAAIDSHNINLIFLRRNLMENLIENDEKFHNKVVGSIVRIRISSSDQKQDIYRLVQVVGTSKVDVPAETGKRTADVMLEILNLDKKEAIAIDTISNQEFSEDECRRLRQSIKCGLVKRLTVGDIQEKAMELQAVRLNDWLETEILRLNHLRDRASEKGHKKELRECVEKLQLLKTPEERQRRLLEIPEVHADSNMDPNYESEEDAGELNDKKQDEYVKQRYTGFSRNVKEIDSPHKGHDISNDSSGRARKDLTNCERSRSLGTTFHADKEDGLTRALDRVNESSCNEGSRACGSISLEKAGNHVDSTSSVIGGWDNQAVVKSGSFSGVASETSTAPFSVGMEPSANDIETYKLWHYRDPNGKIQGPFSMPQLCKWSKTGYFPPDLRIWSIDDKQDDSLLLADALKGQSRNSCGNNEFMRSNGWGSHSSDLTTTVINHNDVQAGSSQCWDSLKGNNSCSDQPLVHSPPPSSEFPGQPYGTLSHDGRGHESERRNSGPNHGNWSGQNHDTQPNTQGHSDQSSGQNWRSLPVNFSSNKWDSSSGFASMAKSTDSSEQNREIDILNLPHPMPKTSKEDQEAQAAENKQPVSSNIPVEDSHISGLPSPTPKPSDGGEKGLDAENKQSLSSNFPVQDSGPSWSSASSLVVGSGAQVPELADERVGHSPTPAKPSVEDRDSGLVSVSSMKPPEAANDHALSSTIPVEDPHISDLPSPTPKSDGDEKAQAEENKQSLSSNFPVQDSGPSWSSASSLVVGGGAQLPEIADERGYSPTPAKPSVEEWDSGLVSLSSLKPSEAANDYDVTPTSKSDQLTHSSPSHPASNASSWQAIVTEPIEFSTLAEESVSDLLAEVDAMESQCGLASPTSAMNCDGELIQGSKNDCFSSIEGLSPTPDPGKSDALSSTGEVQFPSQSRMTDEPLEASPANILDPLKRSKSSTGAGVEGGTKSSDPINHWKADSNILPPAPSTACRAMIDRGTAQRSGSEALDTDWGTIQGNWNSGWGGLPQGITNVGCGTGQGTARGNASMNRGAPVGSIGWESQPRYGGERFTGPRDSAFNGGNSGFSRGRSSWSWQPSFGGSGGGYSRHPPKGQRVCKFYESGHCKKGASCDYWHP
ncbi:hypothetical protein F0562_003680 [Nyssa sinensis]|uniref:Zinc finger CCCH domain-containing protein 44 n=1 Tax=Nyssa sinensis TaxID=561372 RepID=A0A5J5BXU3_9ASTE|nr:hypothetical protein F0562_003680 [Nyssa sinensis]